MKHTVSIVAGLACIAAVAAVVPTLLAQPAATVHSAAHVMGRARSPRRVERHDDHAARATAESDQGDPHRGRGADARGRGGHAQRDRRAASRRRSRHLQPGVVRSGLALGAQPAHVARRSTRRTGAFRSPTRVSSAFATSNAHYGQGRRAIWTDFDTGERCLTDGVPVYFAGYNNNYQIFQTETHVVIVGEMFSDRRVIFLDGRSRPAIPQWLGVSLGRWEGDTLVVETTGFADKGHYWWAGAWRASRPTLRLVERFTRDRRRDHRLPVHDGRSGDVHACRGRRVSVVVEPGVARCHRRPSVRVRVS